MEGDELIAMGKIYVDSKGAGRLYVPKEIVSSMGYRNREKVLLTLEGSDLKVAAAEKEVLE